MKNLLPCSFLVLSMLLINSCSGTDLQDNNENMQVAKSKTVNYQSKAALNDENYVLPVIFSDQNGYNHDNSPCSSYKLYTTSDVLSTQDRVLNVIITSSGTILEGKIFTIPAGQYVSQTVDIFKNAGKSYGNIEITVNSVKENGIITNNYELKSINTQVSNCYKSTPTLPGPLDPSDCEKDTNNNGYPDCYESQK